MVVDLDEGDVQRVRLVVDPLQALQHALATGAPLRAVDWGVGREALLLFNHDFPYVDLQLIYFTLNFELVIHKDKG